MLVPRSLANRTQMVLQVSLVLLADPVLVLAQASESDLPGVVVLAVLLPEQVQNLHTLPA